MTEQESYGREQGLAGTPQRRVAGAAGHTTGASRQQPRRQACEPASITSQAGGGGAGAVFFG